MNVVVLPSRRILGISSGESLLDTLRRHSEPISFSCVDGRCGMCRCFLLQCSPQSGNMETAGPLPSFTECLACQTVPMTDCVIDIPDQNFAVNLPARNDRATVLSVDALALDVVRLTLEVKRPLQCLGGQHFELGFGSNLRRLYSVSRASTGTRFTFDIQVHPYGVASNHIRNTIRAGDQVRIRGPLGDAYRRADTSKLLLVSSGTGLGPMLGLMADCAATGMTNPIYVYAGFSFSEHVYGREELQAAASALKNLRKCEIVIASGALRRGDRRGLLTDALKSDASSFRGWRTHIFGTPTAVESCTRLLLARDMSPRMLHKVAFTHSDRV